MKKEQYYCKYIKQFQSHDGDWQNIVNSVDTISVWDFTSVHAEKEIDEILAEKTKAENGEYRYVRISDVLQLYIYMR